MKYREEWSCLREIERYWVSLVTNIQVGLTLERQDRMLFIAHAIVCRKGVECRVAVVPRRLNTSSTRRLGPTNSMFILSGDFVSMGNLDCAPLPFGCHLLLMQSSTRAIRPVATITLLLLVCDLSQVSDIDSLGNVSKLLILNALITDIERARGNPSTFSLLLATFLRIHDVRDNVSDCG